MQKISLIKINKVCNLSIVNLYFRQSYSYILQNNLSVISNQIQAILVTFYNKFPLVNIS